MYKKEYIPTNNNNTDKFNIFNNNNNNNAKPNNGNFKTTPILATSNSNA